MAITNTPSLNEPRRSITVAPVRARPPVSPVSRVSPGERPNGPPSPSTVAFALTNGGTVRRAGVSRLKCGAVHNPLFSTPSPRNQHRPPTFVWYRP